MSPTLVQKDQSHSILPILWTPPLFTNFLLKGNVTCWYISKFQLRLSAQAVPSTQNAFLHTFPQPPISQYWASCTAQFKWQLLQEVHPEFYRHALHFPSSNPLAYTCAYIMTIQKSLPVISHVNISHVISHVNSNAFPNLNSIEKFIKKNVWPMCQGVRASAHASKGLWFNSQSRACT